MSGSLGHNSVWEVVHWNYNCNLNLTIQMCSGIICGRVLNGELYAQRSQKLKWEFHVNFGGKSNWNFDGKFTWETA